MNNKPKIFDDFPTVDCNECELYYLNQCDGVHKAQKRSCTTFKATRGIDIPKEIKWLKTRLKRLVGALIGLGVFQVIIILFILWRIG